MWASEAIINSLTSVRSCRLRDSYLFHRGSSATYIQKMQIHRVKLFFILSRLFKNLVRGSFHFSSELRLLCISTQNGRMRDRFGMENTCWTIRNDHERSETITNDFEGKKFFHGNHFRNVLIVFLRFFSSPMRFVAPILRRVSFADGSLVNESNKDKGLGILRTPAIT